jgi:hypothetical protein
MKPGIKRTSPKAATAAGSFLPYYGLVRPFPEKCQRTGLFFSSPHPISVKKWFFNYLFNNIHCSGLRLDIA